VVPDWNRMVREHGPMIFGTAWRVLGHVADTEDVVQEVFLEAHCMQQKTVVRNWPGLLRRLAMCRALDRLRQRRHTVPLDGMALYGPGATPEEEAIGHELADRLREALAGLSEREASVFALRYFEDMPYQRIAEVLETTPGAVAVALHKARAKLETLLIEAPTGE
jgi:RNA polymerase sigma-70 factor, ECF subfamily